MSFDAALFYLQTQDGCMPNWIAQQIAVAVQNKTSKRPGRPVALNSREIRSQQLVARQYELIHWAIGEATDAERRGAQISEELKNATGDYVAGTPSERAAYAVEEDLGISPSHVRRFHKLWGKPLTRKKHVKFGKTHPKTPRDY